MSALILEYQAPTESPADRKLKILRWMLIILGSITAILIPVTAGLLLFIAKHASPSDVRTFASIWFPYLVGWTSIAFLCAMLLKRKERYQLARWLSLTLVTFFPLGTVIGALIFLGMSSADIKLAFNR